MPIVRHYIRLTVPNGTLETPSRVALLAFDVTPIPHGSFAIGDVYGAL
jgi:hypothetical protein